MVKVDATTLPAGVTNTVDPDGGTANQATVNLATSGPVNLLQDFGYRDTSSPNTIAGTIWQDTDANGTLTAGETSGWAGVTVALLDSNGNLVATTTTDASGNYSFGNLPDGTYKVDVTDDANVLDGAWKSLGGTPGANNNSQADPYTVTVSAGATNATADFGYYKTPAVLGNFVWDDLNGNGIQDAGEPGLNGVLVTLTVTYPNGATTTVKTVTGDDPSTAPVETGWYGFGNLLLDEDYKTSSGTATPRYHVVISFDVPVETAGTASATCCWTRTTRPAAAPRRRRPTSRPSSSRWRRRPAMRRAPSTRAATMRSTPTIRPDSRRASPRASPTAPWTSASSGSPGRSATGCGWTRTATDCRTPVRRASRTNS